MRIEATSIIKPIMKLSTYSIPKIWPALEEGKEGENRLTDILFAITVTKYNLTAVVLL
jgi:hypothetical protein